jgi:hypothetical protein
VSLFSPFRPCVWLLSLTDFCELQLYGAWTKTVTSGLEKVTALASLAVCAVNCTACGRWGAMQRQGLWHRAA